VRTYVPIDAVRWDNISERQVHIEFGVFVRSTWDFRDAGETSGRNMMALFLDQEGRIVRVVGLDTGFWKAAEETSP
jgi:hypothetical protein